MDFKLVRSKRLFKGRVFDLRADTWRGPDGRAFERHTIAHPGAVAIVPFDTKGRLLLIRQFRGSVGRWLLEIPAGTLEPGEPPAACAKRELIEEIGFAARKWRKLGAVFTAPGFCSERIVLFKAWDLYPRTAAQDEDEHIEPRPMTPAQVRKAVRAGRICDAKTLSALLHLEWL
ncbi:MAG: NUDIX hydrolase [Planctomycetota bacterium]|nr:NUDIX hydrolase [Planctomycetota bacterium]